MDINNSYPDEQGYYVKMYTAVNGIPVKFTTSPAQSASEVIMAVDDTGVTTFDWWNKIELQETVTENTQLLPFDEIETKFKQYIQTKHAETEEDADLPSSENGETHEYFPSDTSIRIDQVKLEYACIPDGEGGEYLLTPVWAFYEETPFTGEMQSISSIFNEPVCHMVINATDGSLVSYA